MTDDKDIVAAFAKVTRQHVTDALQTRKANLEAEIKDIEARLAEFADKVEDRAEEFVAKVEEVVNAPARKAAAKKAPEPARVLQEGSGQAKRPAKE